MIAEFIIDQLILRMASFMEVSPGWSAIILAGVVALHGIWNALLTYNSNRNRKAPEPGTFEFKLDRFLSGPWGRRIDAFLLAWNRRFTVKGRVRDGLARKDPQNKAATYDWN